MNKQYAQEILNQTRENYNQIAQEFSEKRKFLWKDLAPLLQYITKGDKVLDLGCGNGRLFQALENKAVDYLGVDNSEELISIAQTKYPEAKFQTASGLNLPFGENSFDKIVCIAVLHHIPSNDLRLKFLREAKRVLKPDGLLVLTVWKLKQRKSLKLALKYTFLKIVGKSQLDFGDVLVPWADTCQRYIHQFTKQGLRKLVQKAGFAIEKAGVLARPERQDKNIYLIAKKV